MVDTDYNSARDEVTITLSADETNALVEVLHFYVKRTPTTEENLRFVLDIAGSLLAVITTRNL